MTSLPRLKVMTVVGTRPEIIRLSAVIKKLNAVCAHTLVHTGQNYDYELNEIFFNDLSIQKPDYFLNASGSRPMQSIGKIIDKIDKVIENEQPDAFLILGDTNSCLSAIAAKRKKIPLFHMEAGNRCFDERVPEEINRKIVDHIADINLTYSDISREYLLREGLNPDRIIKTGSPMYEVINNHLSSINKSKILNKLNLNKNNYFVVSAHREENIDSKKNFENLIESLNAISNKYGLPVIFSTHPRTLNRINKSKAKLEDKIRILKPLGFFDYLKLQSESMCVLSDSGTITEESSILKFDALNIREAHERPEGMEEAAVMLTGLHKDRMLQCLKVIIDQKKKNQPTTLPVRDYTIPNVSEKVARIILSYRDYVKRTVWKEY